MHITSLQDIQALLPEPFVDREIHASLKKSLYEKEVTVLYGPRQVGKSSEVMRLMEHLLSSTDDKIRKKDIFYFNLDVISSDFRTPDVFLNNILAQKQHADAPTYIFLDEAQRLSDIGLFVKYLYDKNLPIKFILTGSASLDIKEKIKEPLTGRKYEFYLGPLSLIEIINYKKNLKNSIFSLEEILENYMLFGGYPAVITMPTDEKKREKLEEIAESYIFRDIADLFDIRSTENLRLISSFLAENIGSLFSKENLSQMVAVSKYEIEKIMTALEKTFILFFLHPLGKDKVRELMHRPKIYFHDCGIRNAILQKLNPALMAADKGELFENAIAIQLRALYGRNLKFWRTYNQTEIDFIIEKPMGKYEILEAKYAPPSVRIPKNIESFTSLYDTDKKGSTQIIHRKNYWNILAENYQNQP